MRKKFSIVLPIYKNEENLPLTIPYIMERLDLFSEYEIELVMVCDGSPDNSYEIMKKYQNDYPKIIKIAKLNKNYGQRAAIDCGMALATGDAIGVISADLQDPFELFAEMLSEWELGKDLVIAYRDERQEKGLGAMCSQILHKFINKNINHQYPKGGFDFFVIDKSVAKAFVEADTKNNSMQLLLLSLSGRIKQIGYKRRQRAIGKSGWNLSRKINQALNIITIYSDKPFRIFGVWGICGLCVGAILFFLSILLLFMQKNSGFVFLFLSIVCLNSGGILIGISTLGIYGFKWMENQKKIPVYKIDQIIDNTSNKETI